MTTAIRSMGLSLYRGDGGVGAGTQASKTVGTSNQQIIFKAKVAGTAGNSKTAAIVVSGNNTPFGLSVTETAIVVTSATDGSAVATTTVNELLYQLMQDDTFAEHWEATRGAGNGTGVVVASAASALSGGAAGAEVFTLIPGLTDVGGPDQSTDEIDVTSYDSPGGRREFILGLIDSGSITGKLNFNAANAVHQDLYDDYVAKTEVNYQLRFSDGEGFDFACLLKEFGFESPLESQVSANLSWRITGDVTPSF